MKWFLVLLLLCLSVSVGSCEFGDTVQNHWDMDGDGFGDIDDLTNLWVPISPYHTTGGGSATDITIVQKGLPYSQSIKGYLKARDYLDSISYLLYNEQKIDSNYWSFTLRDFTRSDSCSSGTYEYGYVNLTFYDSGGYQIGTYRMGGDGPYTNIVSGPFTNHDNDLFEIFITGGNAYLQVNGTNLGVMGACIRSPTYMGFYSWGRGARPAAGACSVYYTMWIDDITTDDGVVGIGAEPCLTGTFRNHTVTELDNNELDVSWHARTIPKSSYDGAQYTLQVKRLINGTTINSTVLKVAGDITTKPAGFVEYNWSTMFGAESYGAYNFNLYKDTTLIGQDYIIYKSLLDDSWINIEKDQYGIGDTMKVTYFLDTPDFTPNDYYIKLYDAGGEVKETRGIFASSGTEYFETLGYAVGMTYSLLVKDTEPATDYEDGRDLVELAFDVTNMLDSVFIRGITYNAETGVPLPNVSINFTQEDNQYNTTSDANGTYEFTYKTGSGDILTNETVEFVTDVLIEANASKPLWWHENFSFTPLVAGTYDIDLYLLPDCDNITHDNYTIAGMTLSYPLHQAVGTATTNIRNATTYSDSMLSSADMGYYMFDELSVTTGGMYVGIVNETFNSSEYDTWVSLAHSIIQVNSQKVTNTTDEIAFYNITDYLMNYTDGKIKINSSGNMTNYTDYHIDYNYFSSGIPFYVNATKIGYKDSDTYTVPVVDECEYQNIILHGLYNLTIYAKHAQTHISLTDFNAIFNEVDQKSSNTSTHLMFTQVEYGIWKVQVDKEGFYSDVKYIYVAQDTNSTFYLAPLSDVTEAPEGGAGTYYAPHRVEFKVQNLFGYPVEDVVVNTTVLETTSLSWDWLWRALGMREDVAAEMQNGSMNGCTDSHGGISFLMEPTMRYRITFTKNETNINESLTIYPKDDTYLVIVTTLTEERNRNEYVSWNLNTSDHNSTHAYLTFNYTDNLNKTSMLYFFVKDGNRTEIHNQTFTYDDSISTSHLVNRTKGQSYIWGFNCSHDEFGYFAQSKFITFKSRLIDLAILPDDKYYTWISIALLIFIAGLFSVTVSRFGYVIIPGTGLILSYIGWLSTNITLLTVAMGLGILAFMGKTERDKGL
jgi:hypothetical protein